MGWEKRGGRSQINVRWCTKFAMHGAFIGLLHLWFQMDQLNNSGYDYN